MKSEQTLIFDADDTLWENNVVFERVIEDYLDWVAHPTLDRAQVRAVLNEIELANTVAHGYGSRVFLRTLGDCFGRLNERPASPTEEAQIRELAAALAEHRVELLPDVAETLDQLGSRHSLFLLTKGDPDEQQRKIDASNVSHHFIDIHIVAEKNVDTYHSVTSQHDLDPARTWMIGNSPKSDILSARRAGLNAVFIPNDNTWALEHDVLDPNDTGVLHLRQFGELLLHF
jgi:putative hydrolase of the HAD superfamily